MWPCVLPFGSHGFGSLSPSVGSDAGGIPAFHLHDEDGNRPGGITPWAGSVPSPARRLAWDRAISIQSPDIPAGRSAITARSYLRFGGNLVPFCDFNPPLFTSASDFPLIPFSSGPFPSPAPFPIVFQEQGEAQSLLSLEVLLLSQQYSRCSGCSLVISRSLKFQRSRKTLTESLQTRDCLPNFFPSRHLRVASGPGSIPRLQGISRLPPLVKYPYSSLSLGRNGRFVSINP